MFKSSFLQEDAAAEYIWRRLLEFRNFIYSPISRSQMKVCVRRVWAPAWGTGPAPRAERTELGDVTRSTISLWQHHRASLLTSRTGSGEDGGRTARGVKKVRHSSSSCKTPPINEGDRQEGSEPGGEFLIRGVERKEWRRAGSDNQRRGQGEDSEEQQGNMKTLSIRDDCKERCVSRRRWRRRPLILR